MKKTRQQTEASQTSQGHDQAENNPDERLHRVAIAAYFKAEARGFLPGRELDDWLAAERES